jgi:hypothetical protein
VANAQRLTVALFGVDDGSSTGDIGVRVGMVLGDTTGNGEVTANGTISSSDIGLVKAQSGNGLPSTSAGLGVGER